MNSRRKFLRNSGSMLLGGLVASKYASASFFEKNAMHPIGLQLFTLFGDMDKDPDGSLKKVAAIGYKELESALSFKGGYYGMKPKEFAKLAKDNGLSWQSHHVLGAPFKMPPGGIKMPGDSTKKVTLPPMRSLKDNMQEIVDEAAEGGIPYLVCAAINLGNKQEIEEAVVILSKTGEACKKANITFCYHNHTHEFETVDGHVPYDVLLSQISPDILKMELDLGWATNAGVDPVDLFAKHPGRFPLWHVKDMTKDKKQPTEVGSGYIDFKRIFEHGEKSGMKHFFVEQDGAPRPFDNIAVSYKNLTKIIG